MPLRRLDVEGFRSSSRPTIVKRRVEHPLVVLGSMQPADLVCANGQAEILRRRGGGGAVYVDPDSSIWIDLWLPASDSTSRLGVVDGLIAVGQLWRLSLEELGLADLVVACPERAPVPSAVCFSSIGYGELLDNEGRKLVGMTAWRAREGSLYQTTLYRVLDRGLPELLNISEDQRLRAREALECRACDLLAFGRADLEATSLLSALSTMIDQRVDSTEEAIIAEQGIESS